MPTRPAAIQVQQPAPDIHSFLDRWITLDTICASARRHPNSLRLKCCDITKMKLRGHNPVPSIQDRGHCHRSDFIIAAHPKPKADMGCNAVRVARSMELNILGAVIEVGKVVGQSLRFGKEKVEAWLPLETSQQRRFSCVA